jgi:large conductance mechanosensitive channel
MSIISEFKSFALKGNVVDMAVGIIIGAAFGKIINSFVSDILMPPLGKLMGNADFSNLFFALDGGTYENLAAVEAAGAPVIRYGVFTNTVVDFVIVAFAIFVAIKWMNTLRKKKEVAVAAAPVAPEPSAEELLLTEIRDLLKQK